MDDDRSLRPIERRMRRLADAGASDIEIAWRFRRTPRNVRQVMALSHLRHEDVRRPATDRLRPIERRVLRWREDGADFDDMAARFRRGPAFLEQVEQLAHYKLNR